MAELLFKQVRAVVDKRTTAVCLHAAGLIMPLDEPFETLAGDFMDPPFHLHCRSVTGPWLMGMSNDIRAEANRELAKRPLKQRRIGPDGEIGGSVPPPADGNGPSGYSFPGSADKAWRPKATPGTPAQRPAVSMQEAARLLDLLFRRGSEDQIREAGLYVGGSALNLDLRQGDLSEYMQQRVDDLTGYIERQKPFGEPIALYRGMSKQFLPDADLLVGQTIKDPAFMSTSLKESEAQLFGNGNIVMEIIARPTDKGLPINHAWGPDQSGVPKEFRQTPNALDNEAEVLLRPGTAVLILSVEDRVYNGASYKHVKAVIVDG